MTGTARRILGAGLILAAVSCLPARAQTPPETVNVGPAAKSSDTRATHLEWKDFAFNGQKYPILYEHELILVNKAIASVAYFRPLHSPDRPEVNPAKPAIQKIGDKSLITFGVPGEYYLVLNESYRLRVLILNRKQSIDLNVVALSDFVAANTSNINGNDAEWYKGPEIFTQNYFSSDQPKMLLCGPTHGFLKLLIGARFGLPTRAVTFTGVYFEQGRIQYGTHNTLEVYLPENRKWVLFDPNNGFMAKWMDAFDITDAVRNASATKNSFTKDDFKKLKLDFHYNVDVKRPFNNFSDQNLFFTGMLSKESQREQWPVLMQIFLGGPAYWGGVAGSLPGDYHLYSSLYHLDPFLIEAQARWQGNWPLKVLKITPDDLKRRLNERYAPEIAERKWEAIAWR